MMQYIYHARNAQGQAIQGRMSASSQHTVIEHLRARALTAVDVHQQHRIAQALAPLRKASHASAMIVALRTLGTLLGVGLPIRRALEIVIQATRQNALREGFYAVIASVENGDSLGTAMQRREDLFNPMTVALVHAGERGGVLAETLERHAHNLEQQHALQRRLMTTMIYPVILLLSALGLIAFLMVSVLPMFATLFLQLHVDEPLILRIALAIPSIFTPMNAAVVTTISVALFALLHQKRNDLRIPVLEPLREKATSARLARALATLLKAGVPLPEALLCVRPILTLQRFRLAVDHILAALRDGNTLASASEAQGVFDPLFAHLIRVGEETGTLDTQLFRVADWFERDFSEATTRAAALIEPTLIIGIGALVGTVVFSVFVPLYSLIGGIR